MKSDDSDCTTAATPYEQFLGRFVDAVLESNDDFETVRDQWLATCPPEEKAITITRSGSIPHSFAWARIIRMARWASWKGAGWR